MNGLVCTLFGTYNTHKSQLVYFDIQKFAPYDDCRYTVGCQKEHQASAIKRTRPYPRLPDAGKLKLDREGMEGRGKGDVQVLPTQRSFFQVG